jgi:hypothetical protein
MLLLATLPPLWAKEPPLDAIHPAGGRVGTTVTVKAEGKFDAWPPRTWCSSDRVTVTALKDKGKLEFKIAEDTPPGACLIRLYNDDGASPPRSFMIGTLPEFTDVEKNDTLATAQAAPSLPAVINGRLAVRGDTDFYKLPLKKGQTLVAHVDAYSLGSPIDPFLHLFGPDGAELTIASDSHNRDPLLVYTATVDGDHTLQIMAIEHIPSVQVFYAGKNTAVYRLTLTTGPWLHRVDPLAVQSGVESQVQLIGPNLKDVTAAVKTTELDTVVIGHPSAPNSLTAAIVPYPVIRETSTPDDEPQLLNVPVSVTGYMATQREEDVYRFTVKTDEWYIIRIKAAAHHSPMDPVLTVKKPDGGVVKTVDDYDKTPDSEYVLKTSREGDYTLHVRDARGWHGEDYAYRLDLTRASGAVYGTVDKDRYSVEAGDEAAVKVKFKRMYGHTAKVNLQAQGLPPGVVLEAEAMPDKSKDVTAKLKVGADAKPFSGPIGLALVQTDDADKVKASKIMAYSFLTDTARGDYVVNETDSLWLTIKPKPAKKEDKK